MVVFRIENAERVVCLNYDLTQCKVKLVLGHTVNLRLAPLLPKNIHGRARIDDELERLGDLFTLKSHTASSDLE